MTRNTGGVREFTVALTCAVAVAIGAADAVAQEPGVIVDPDSPSGKEYAIPLESARRQADPSDVPTSGASSAGSAALFGEGVIASRGNGGGPPRRSGARGSAEKARRGSGGSDQATGSRPGVPDVVGAAASRPAAPDGGIGTPILVLGLGLLVVLIGVVAGVVIRRRANV